MVLCCTEGEYANGQGEAIRTSHGLHALSCTGTYVYNIMGDVGQESQHEFDSQHVCISACVCCAHRCAYTDVYRMIHTVYIRKTILDTLKMLSLDSTSH